MWEYSEKVQEHFFNPKNAGVLADANAVGEVGALACGDALKLMLNIDPVTEIILDARFQTFGCGSAIASSSALTEMVIGRTVAQATVITNRDIADFLGGLPPEKMHCSVLGYEALQAAIADFRGETWSAAHEDETIICRCHGVEAGTIERVVREHKLNSVEQVTAHTKAAGGCTTCYERIEDILVRVNSALVGAELRASDVVRKFVDASASTAAPSGTGRVTLLAARPRPAPAPPRIEAPHPAHATSTSPLTPASPLPPPSAGMTNLKKIRLIEETIEDLRVYLRKDGGDCELIDVDGSNVLVSLTGACVGCQMASVTVSGIQERLIAKLGVPVRVIPVGRNGHGH
jgi:NifU-like protein